MAIQYDVTVSISIDGKPKGSQTYTLPGLASEAIGAIPTYITRNTYGAPTDGREYVMEVLARGGSEIICDLQVRHRTPEGWTVLDRITGEVRKWNGLGHTLGRVGHHPW